MAGQPITQIAIIDGVSVMSEWTTDELASAVHSIDAILTNDCDDRSVHALNAAAIAATQHPNLLPKIRVLIPDSGFVTIPRMNAALDKRFGGSSILRRIDSFASEETLSAEFGKIFVGD